MLRAAASVAAVLVLGLAAPVFAHRLDLVAHGRNGAVEVTATYADGTPVRDADVKVIEVLAAVNVEPLSPQTAGDDTMAVGRTDADGRFRFRPARAVRCLVVVSDGKGHRAEMEIPAESIGSRSDGGAEPLAHSSAGRGLLMRLPLWLRVTGGVLLILLLTAGCHYGFRRGRARPENAS